MTKHYEQRKKANAKYQSTLDIVRLYLPKGQKRTLEKAAHEAGESVNEYIRRATLERMGLESWPEIEDKESGPDA